MRALIRFEGLAVFIACLYFYRQLDASWVLFVLLWLLPDLSMVGYLRDTRTGAITYNLAHNYLLPLFIVIFGLSQGNNFVASLGVILASHIGLDRFLGFGLKYPDNFKHTHIQQL